MPHIFDSSKRDRLHSEERYRALPPECVLDHLDLLPGETFLDIGAGTGFFAIPAAAMVVPDGKVIAADISSDMLETLVSRSMGHPGRIETVIADLDRVPVKDNIADVVFLAFVYHELQDRRRWLIEINRLLADGGRGAIVEWDTVDSPGGPPQGDRVGYAELAEELRTAGFVPGERIEVSPYQYLCLFRKD